MTAIEQLLALEEIRRLKAEYFRCVDAQDWEGLLGLFTADAEIDLREAVTPADPALCWREPRGFVDNTARTFAGVQSMHFGNMPLIELHSPTSASGQWSMEDILWAGDESLVLPPGRHQGWGRYYDRYARVDGRWKIAASRLVRIHPEFRPAAAAADQATG